MLKSSVPSGCQTNTNSALNYHSLPLKEDVNIQLDSPLCFEAYESRDNFKIEYTKRKNVNKQLCCVYFSSNGIYYPNTANTFYREIMLKDKYEWYGNRVKDAYKHIFIRDVFKQWYVNGINKELCTVELLANWLLNETRGYKTIVIGSSAGGYATILLGGLIKASLMIAFCPQIDISDAINKKGNPLLYGGYKYNNVSSYIKRNRERLFLFYSKYVQNDQKDMNIAKEVSANVILLKSKVHGVPFFSGALPQIINMNEIQLRRLAGKEFRPFWFSIRYLDLGTTLKVIVKKASKAIKRILL